MSKRARLLSDIIIKPGIYFVDKQEEKEAKSISIELLIDII